MTHPSPWGEVPLRPREPQVFELGTLRLVIQRVAKEIWIQTQRGPDLADPDAGDWQRWAAPMESHIEVRPAVPDRLLVVSHEHRYHLPPRGETRFYVRIPLFVQVVLRSEVGEVVIADVPSIVLSDTWWGTHIEGELSYWLTTKARVELTDDLFLPHLGMCPFRLLNDSPEALPVERFAVRVPHLTLFSEAGHNWTDEVNVRYEDSPEGSEIRFATSAPAEARAAGLIASPRVESERGFRARTFDRLRSLSSKEL